MNWLVWDNTGNINTTARTWWVWLEENKVYVVICTHCRKVVSSKISTTGFSGMLETKLLVWQNVCKSPLSYHSFNIENRIYWENFTFWLMDSYPVINSSYNLIILEWNSANENGRSQFAFHGQYRIWPTGVATTHQHCLTPTAFAALLIYFK